MSLVLAPRETYGVSFRKSCFIQIMQKREIRKTPATDGKTRQSKWQPNESDFAEMVFTFHFR